MSAPTSPAAKASSRTLWLTGCLLLAGGTAVWFLAARLDQLAAGQQRVATVLEQVLGEVTRTRIEQSAGAKGPAALLEKLRTYAPLLADARTAQPDYANAKKEMDAVLRAFASLGKDGWQPIQERLLARNAAKEFDEVKWLLEASVQVDGASTAPLLKEILLGRKLPSPRLRWFVSDLLGRIDRPLAQATLRQVLLTEYSRGIDPDRAAYYGGGVPDQAALATTGYHNFVNCYVRSEDPKLEETLLMVMGRAEHDAVTVQECMKALSVRKCLDAVKPIEKLYHKPPLGIENAVFLNHCLEALFQIQGRAAKPFLEAALAQPTHELVGQKIQYLLARIEAGDFGLVPVLPAPAANQKK